MDRLTFRCPNPPVKYYVSVAETKRAASLQTSMILDEQWWDVECGFATDAEEAYTRVGEL